MDYKDGYPVVLSGLGDFDGKTRFRFSFLTELSGFEVSLVDRVEQRDIGVCSPCTV
jgi:hypothetical protein